MSPIVLVGVVVFAGAVFVLIWTLLPQPGPGLLEERLAGVGVPEPLAHTIDADELELQRPLSERVIQPLVGSIGHFMMRRTKQAQLDELRKKLLQAGSKQRPESLLAFQLGALLGGAALGYGLSVLLSWSSPLNFAAPAALAILGYMYPASTLKRKIKKRAKEMRVVLPGVLDLLTISMEAGLSLDMAIMRVCENDHSALGQEFQKVLNEVRLGRPRMEALTAMSDRNALEELSSFIRAVVQAEPLGVSIANVLRIQSEELRRLRRQRAEEAGHRAPILMLLPMMMCIFPCIFIILLGPAAVSISHTLGG